MPPTRHPDPPDPPPPPGPRAPRREDLGAWLRELYDAHSGAVFRYFVREGFSHDRSEDLTHDVFLLVYKGLEGFEGRSSPKTWIFTIARNLRVNTLQRARALRRRGVEIPLAGGSRDDEAGPSGVDLADERAPDPLSEIVAREGREVVNRWIETLPPRMRSCLRLWLEGRSYQEIADLEGVSPETVRAQLRQARERLRSLVGSDP